MLIVLIYLFAVLSIVCGILGAMSILPMWVFWVCLGIFWLSGAIEAVVESVSSILKYRRWIYETDNIEEKEKYRSWIRKEVREMLTFPWFAILMVTFWLAIAIAGSAYWGLTEWFEGRKTKKALAH